MLSCRKGYINVQEQRNEICLNGWLKCADGSAAKATTLAIPNIAQGDSLHTKFAQYAVTSMHVTAIHMH